MHIAKGIPIQTLAPSGINDILMEALSDAPYQEDLILFMLRGKKVRSTLAVAATHLVKGSDEVAMTAAAILECLHSASLIQDDIIDNANTRRGGDALHVRFGIDVALMLADFLIGTAFSILEQAAGISDNNKVQAIRILAACIKTCVRGQLAELMPVTCFAADAESLYLKTISEKTAPQFVIAATLGPLLSGCDRDAVQLLSKYGEAVGAAFQIRDDVLDIRGDTEKLGKPIQNSLEQSRLLLPLVYLAKFGSDPARLSLQRYIETGKGWSRVCEFLIYENIWDIVTKIEQQYISMACKNLEKFPQDNWRLALESIAIGVINRDA